MLYHNDVSQLNATRIITNNTKKEILKKHDGY